MAFLSGASANEEITLYTHRHYESDQALFEQFEKETGIDVKVVKASADSLMERLKAEGGNTPADVLITADAGRLHKAKEQGLLQPVESEVLIERIPANLRDPDNNWFGFTERARIIAYAKDRVKPEELSTYEALAEPQWRGRVLARSSSNIYNQSLLASIIAADGEKEAYKWASGVRKNMARPPQGSDRDQMRAVAAGLGDVAIVNTYYLGLLLNSDNPKDKKVGESLGVFFPNQKGRGTHINISGAGVVANASNPDGGKRFLEFLASDQAQESFPESSYEYPAVEGIQWSPLLESWGQFKQDDLSLSELGALNAEAIRVFNRAGWE
ncbi:Fe(3+) ABC transporter substrate-binding protein [Rubellicoccus peritrichatus]|uniref:Fe(3+) ABC transporter substrate-binding protein n=1 Tax=Rubellicoccus peritrichatus TaxID=3080537 RepID=A0AAQ3QUD0_9BACT|nr:Fe(3+) ABC transporter substrate-binding protein [Puniceicoccus sp. CR14]WOO39557.1 Fe(3+) ABC transporter substrate-binding protein [Puniceicoccus sp. CR14]